MTQSAPRSIHTRPSLRTERPDPPSGAALGLGFSLGKVLGTPVRADWSLLFVFILIALNLAGGLLPAWHPDWGFGLRWGVAFGAAVLFLVSILLHELSHALVGRALGAKIRGITLFMFGGVAHVEREPARPAAELWMAVVGPITSLAIGVVATLAGSWLGAHALRGAAPDDPVAAFRQLGPVATLLLWLGPINIILAGFNLLPGFPLDGGRVFRALLWWGTGDLNRATRWASWVGQGLAWLMIGVGLSMVLGLAFPILGGGWFQGLWLGLIGWFLNAAARAARQQLAMREAVGDLQVAQLMDTRLQSVSPDADLASLVHEHLSRDDQRSYPVIDGNTLEGLVSWEDVRQIAPDQWQSTPVKNVMKPAAGLLTLRPEEEAGRAVELLAEEGNADPIAVVDNGILRGLLWRHDVARWVELHHRRAA